jgi:hypothetical protein
MDEDPHQRLKIGLSADARKPLAEVAVSRDMAEREPLICLVNVA